MAKENSKDAIVLPIIVISIIVLGIIGLYYLQKASVNNRRICSYLGGIWMPEKDSQGNVVGTHRCYSYEEYYKN